MDRVEMGFSTSCYIYKRLSRLHSRMPSTLPDPEDEALRGFKKEKTARYDEMVKYPSLLGRFEVGVAVRGTGYARIPCEPPVNFGIRYESPSFPWSLASVIDRNSCTCLLSDILPDTYTSIVS
jgi:hypothetical protein